MDAGARELLAAIGADLREEGAAVALEVVDHGPDRLTVALGTDASGHRLDLELMVLPETAGSAILQCYVGLPYRVDPAATEHLYRFLAEANAVTTLGAFGYLAADERVYYRHNLPVQIEAPDAVAIGTSLSLAASLVGALGPFIERVAAGQDVERVLDELAEAVRLDAEAGGLGDAG